MRLQSGTAAPSFDVCDIADRPIALESYRGRKVLVSFFRYAACPLCNIRVHRLIQAYPRLRGDGLDIIAFFESPRASILEHVGKQDAPFPIVPDPDRAVYARYGVESSWAKFLKGAKRAKDLLDASREGLMKVRPEGDVHLVPADFLLSPDLRIHTAYYGDDIGDHVPLETIDAFVAARTPDGASP